MFQIEGHFSSDNIMNIGLGILTKKTHHSRCMWISRFTFRRQYSVTGLQIGFNVDTCEMS